MADPNEVLTNRWYVDGNGIQTCKFCVGVHPGDKHNNLCPYEALALAVRRIQRMADELETAEQKLSIIKDDLLEST